MPPAGDAAHKLTLLSWRLLGVQAAPQPWLHAAIERTRVLVGGEHSERPEPALFCERIRRSGQELHLKSQIHAQNAREALTEPLQDADAIVASGTQLRRSVGK